MELEVDERFAKIKTNINHGQKRSSLIADNIFEIKAPSDSFLNLPPDLKGWVKLFLKLQVQGVKAERTYKAQSFDLNTFVAFYQEFVTSTDIRRWLPQVTNRFLEHLGDKDLKAKTIKRYLASTRSFAKWILKTRPDFFPLGDPTHGVKAPTQEAMRPKGLTDKQVKRFLDAAYFLICQTYPDEKVATIETKQETWYSKAHRKTRRPFRDFAIIMLLLNGGLRRQEICDLNLGQLEKKHLRNVKCKGNQYRDLLLGEETLKALDVYLKEERPTDQAGFEGSSAFFLPSVSKKHRNQTGYLATRSVNAIIKKVADTANRGLPEAEQLRVHPHMFRHTHAYQVLKKGRSLTYLQKRLGHQSMHFLSLYTQMQEEEEQELLDDAEFK